MFLNIQIDWIILQTYNQQFTYNNQIIVAYHLLRDAVQPEVIQEKRSIKPQLSVCCSELETVQQFLLFIQQQQTL